MSRVYHGDRLYAGWAYDKAVEARDKAEDRAEAALAQQHRLEQRCAYLFDLAQRHGATREELRPS